MRQKQKRMKTLLTIMIMTTQLLANGQATTNKKSFSRETTVAIEIGGSPQVIWALLTNASDYTRWNGTITSMEGDIALKETIKLKSTLDPDRVFKLKVKAITPGKEMIWSSGAAPFFKGVRTYTLSENDNGKTTFTMSEKIGGLMFPMAAGSIPPFDQVFEQFANDLKKEAELITNQNQ